MTATGSAKTPSVLDKLASLTTIRDIEVFELSVLKTLAELLKVQQLSLYKLDHRNLPSRLIHYSTETRQAMGKKSVSESHEEHVAEIDIPEYIKNAQEWIVSTNRPYTAEQGNIYLCVYPIVGTKNIVGYISLKLPHKLSETDTLIIKSLLSISHNFHSLLEENQKDKLTGLLNRQTFEDNISKIQSILRDADNDDSYDGLDKREYSPSDSFWLAIMDIDHFKHVNDNYGHIYGDEVLLLMSQLMRNSFRGSDLLFRFGGEEFVAIVRGHSQNDVLQVLERFRCSVEEFNFPQINSVTISIGVTKLNEEHAIPADIVGRADKALYFAKQNGRNQIHFYEHLVTNGSITENIEAGMIELF